MNALRHEIGHPFTPEDLRRLERTPLTANLLHSFGNSHPEDPLASLAPLVTGDWLSDTVIDSRACLVARRINSLQYPSSDDSSRTNVLFLDCTFGVSLDSILSNDPSRFLRKTRELLRDSPPRYIVSVYNKHGVHWAAVAIDVDRRTIFEGDSLDFPPMPLLREKIAALFSLTDVPDYAWFERKLPISRQPPGSGDCGLYAMNAIEHFLDSSIPLCESIGMAGMSKMRQEWFHTRLRDHLDESRRLNSEVCFCSLQNHQFY